MALIDLKTNLKSLKYGDDRLGGGNSDQPYIQTDINTGKLSISNSRGIGLLKPVETVANGIINTIGSLSKFVGNADDGFIRGGAVGAAQASTTDLLRIGKFFIDAPRGPLFIAKQVGLQLSNPRLEVKKGVRGVLSNILSPQGTLATLTGGLLEPTRIYNLGINTLAQVPVNAFGGHFNRHGLLPIQDDDSKYLNVTIENNKGNLQDADFPSTPNNRLARLRKQFKLGDQKPNDPPGLLGKIALSPIKIIGSLLKGQPLNIFKGEDTIDFYIGGPKSVYGIGYTTIRRYDNTESKDKINDAFDKSFRIASIAKIDFNTRPTGPYAIGGPSLSDVEVKIPALVENNNTIPGLNGISPAAKNYSKLKSAVLAIQQIDQQIPFSAVRAANYKPKDYGPFKEKTFTTKPNTGLDRTAEDFKYYGDRGTSKDGSQAAYSNTDLFARKDADIMTVAFRVVDPFENLPDLNSAKEKARRHLFSAYMTGYKDSFSGNWNEINYAGRAESLYIYNKFKRNVTFNIKIPSFSRKHLFEKHRALGQLAATTAGSYKGGFLGGVFIQLNVGNYLVGEYGILNSLDYSIPDEATWDITPEGRLSTLIEASFNFTIVHKELPQYEPAAGTNPGKAFFNYLPDGIKGFIQKGDRDQAEQTRINRLFKYDTYTPNADGKKSFPEAVIGVELEPEPNPPNSIKFPPIPTDDIFFDESSVVEIKNVAKKRFIGPPLEDGSYYSKDSNPVLSRSQQAKADAAFNSDPLGINAFQQQQSQDPLGIKKYLNSIP